METYNDNWACDFPISSGSYKLSKPRWEDVVGPEKEKALSLLTPRWREAKLNESAVYGTPVIVPSDGIDKKIYARFSQGYECGGKSDRTTFWIEGLSFKGGIRSQDTVYFSGRIYFIHYQDKAIDDRGGSIPAKSFFVGRLEPAGVSEYYNLGSSCRIARNKQ
jgi:hypothetical protein